MAITTTIKHTVAKGIKNNDTNIKNSWWGCNFNMPVPNLFSNMSWTETGGPSLSYIGAGTSFSCLGFTPGLETTVATSVITWSNDGASAVDLDEYLWSRWYDTDGSTTLFWLTYGLHITSTVSAGSWTSIIGAANIGICPWEIDVSGTFGVATSITGDHPIAETKTSVAFSNIPTVTQLSSTKIGYIWVEGNNLCFINANGWKHALLGTKVSTTPGTSKAGSMWIDTSNDLHWVGGNGYDYKVSWKIKQFASYWGNSSTSEVNAGTSKAGFIWVDSEFGLTHLSYIGYDGYKYLVGSGNYPYN